jgi:hypothetical protein
MRSRIPAAFVLSALLTAAASGQTTPQPDPKEQPKGPTKLPEPKWPTEIGKKDLKAWLKDVTSPDPAVREAAIRTLPNFGPDVRKEAGKLLLARLAFPSDGGERDPGVRVALMNAVAVLGFDNPADETEALRLLGLTVDSGADGGLARLTAVQAIAAFGSKAERQIERVAGRSLGDSAYATRQSIARTLGAIGFNEKFGPNRIALNRLAATLARDACVAVRMEALQSLVVLGAPWAEPRKPDDKTLPKIDKGAAKSVADVMRERLGIVKGKVAVEPDAQLQIWCRVVLMRFDPDEINDANLSAIARHTAAPDAGPKVQALQALALFGEQAGSQVDAVVRALDDADPQVLGLAISALASMGVKASGAVGALEKLEQKLAKMRDDQLSKPEVVKFLTDLKDPKDKEKIRDALQEEQMRKAVVETIKWIRESKPGLPGGDRAAGGGAATP